MPEVRIKRTVTVSPNGYTSREFIEGATHEVDAATLSLLVSVGAVNPPKAGSKAQQKLQRPGLDE